MANEEKCSEMIDDESKRFELHTADNDVKMLALLQDALKCHHNRKRLDLLARCVSFISSCDRSSIMHLLSLEHFRRDLTCVLDLAIIPTFESKEYFSYEKQDFQWYPEITYYVLCIIDHILNTLTCRIRDKDTNANTKESNSEHEMEHTPTIHDINFFLPKLSLLAGAHRNLPLWSSTELELLTSQVLDKILLFSSFTSLNELLSMNIYLDNSSAVKDKSVQVTLLEAALSHCIKPLSKNMWYQNPFVCHSFHWLITQMKLPNLSNIIELVMSVALNFLEDHQPMNKIRGISCLHHLIKNTSAEEMRWLNRADVIYEKLKNQMYLKEAEVIEHLLPCLFDILKVLESPPDLERHHNVLDVLLRDTEGENLLTLRKIYINNLKTLIDQVGIHSVKHLKLLVKIVGSYLEVDDGFGEVSARPCTLKLLESVIRVSWPRIQHHADALLKLVLNFIADINCAHVQDGGDLSSIQNDLTAEAIQRLILLSEVCPNVLPCITAGLKAGMNSVDRNSNFYNVLKNQLANIES